MTESEAEKSSAAGCDKKTRGYYKNPYINYYVRLFDLKEFKGKPAREVAKYAGQSWRNMKETEKQEYREMTKLATKRRKRTRGIKRLKRIRRERKTQTVIGIKQEKVDYNNNKQSARTEYQDHNEPEPCPNDESHSSSEAFVDNTEATTGAETCDPIQGGAGTMWHSDSDDTLECHDFCPRPPTPMPSECSQRVCMTPSRRRRVKRVREEESPPPAPKRSKIQGRTTSPTGISTPKRTRNTDIHDLSTLKRKEMKVKGKEREKKKSVKRKLSFSSDSESVYSFEPRSKRKRITKTYPDDDDDDKCPQNRNNSKRTYAKAKVRKQGDKSNVKTKKQGRWELNSSSNETSTSNSE